MAEVLTMNSTTLCGKKVEPPSPPPPAHGGEIAKTSTAKLTVDQKPVLTKASVMGKTVSGCTTPTTTTVKACTSVLSVLTLESTKLTVNGQPVLIGLTGTTGPAGAIGTLYAEANQTKLKAT